MITAREIVENKQHPLYKAFLSYCGNVKPSLRQARKFLNKYPQYRGVKEG